MQKAAAPKNTGPYDASLRDLSDLDVGAESFAGGKGANLGELVRAGLPVPSGFVVGAPAYAVLCDDDGLRERIAARLDRLEVGDPQALETAASEIRQWIESEPMPQGLEAAITGAYDELCGGRPETAVAVRSSAIGEDSADSSFAGMNETVLNVQGPDSLIEAVRRCWSSLFGARTISYRAAQGLGQAEIDIAVIVQRQIVATRSGVMFTVDPASGDPERLLIEASLGLGEAVVSGSVTPDRYVVDKPARVIVLREARPKKVVLDAIPGGGVSRREPNRREALELALSDGEALELADLGVRVEQHYGVAQDTEWCFDSDGTAWMLQARPITATMTPTPSKSKGGGLLLQGLGASAGVAAGPVQVVVDIEEASALDAGSVLVAPTTAPDWVPAMRHAAAIVTDSGGMTCHAAIVARELGIPCVTGTSDGTQKLRDSDWVVVDGAKGTVTEGDPQALDVPGRPAAVAPIATPGPVTATKVMVNLSEPSRVELAAARNVDGVGLLRGELMMIEALGGTHPRLLIQQGRETEFIDRMSDGLKHFAEAFSPRPVTYRTTDLRSNEFRGLTGGDTIEPIEANPMIGYRGAFRYMREPDLLALEAGAIARVWEQGLTNLHVMLPFLRTPGELVAARRVFAESGLLEQPGFELWVMAEVPSALHYLERYAELGVSGISIGSNDLTQLILGADRDSELLAEIFDERDPAVTDFVCRLIGRARSLGMATSICGQAPSVHPEYAELLVRAGIGTISVSLDVVDRTRRLVAAAEQRLLVDAAVAGQSDTSPQEGEQQ